MQQEHLDVVIVGAGLSGIGAAGHLRRHRPRASYAILESRGAIGGTWDLFRYPGVRSDSDMFTLGYSFRPWTAPKAIADGESIRRYIRDTAAEEGIEEHVRLRSRVTDAAWDSGASRWTLTVRTGADDAATSTLTCGFLLICSGYYRYDEGYTPEIEGLSSFAGPVVHPQHWPHDLDVTGKRVVVIGSGATAITLVPSLARTAERVTMLQRSPTYVAAVPARDHLADRLRGRLPEQAAYRIVRWKNVLSSIALYQLSRRRPERMKAILKRAATAKLPAGFDVDRHFSPRYDPWDQRLCAAPNGDFFRAVSAGTADVVTDAIREVEPGGVRLASGDVLPADVLVTATGLNLLALGGMRLSVDGRPVDLGETLAYKGMMLAGVPNLAMTIGYTNASWTLKADLVARYVCRLLDHMQRRAYVSVTPVAPAPDRIGALVPLIGLTSGYVLRAAAAFPQQARVAPWRLHQNYVRDLALLRFGRIADSVRFRRAEQPVPVGRPG